MGGGVLGDGLELGDRALTIPGGVLYTAVIGGVSAEVVNRSEPGEYNVVTKDGVVDILPVVDVVAVIVVGSGEGHTGVIGVIEGHHHIV